jgi:hypothetical protein
MFDDAFLLDTEAWEWKEVTKKVHPSPGLLVGHTAELAYCCGKEGGVKAHGGEVVGAGEEEEAKEETEEKESRVMIFGGQDKLGGRREELYLIKI